VIVSACCVLQLQGLDADPVTVEAICENTGVAPTTVRDVFAKMAADLLQVRDRERGSASSPAAWLYGHVCLGMAP
jgi:hypothetical protein